MANGHGGKRPGSGRPRKPLAEKLLDGSPDKRKPKVLKFDGSEGSMVKSRPECPERLTIYRPHWDDGQPTSQDIWKETVDFLETTGCLHLINPTFIEEYAILKSRFYESERMVSRLTVVYQEKQHGNLEENPAVNAGLKYFKAAEIAWDKIWKVVQQNSEGAYGETPNDDLMAKLLKFDRGD